MARQPDSVWVKRLVEAAALKPGETVLDIGAGYGALTKPSLAAVRPGGKVVAVEKVRHPADVLRRLRDVEVVHGDALQVPLPRCDAVVANPPFRILAPLVMRLLDAGFGRAVLVVPDEMARRLAAKPKEEDYGRLTVQVGVRAKVGRLFAIPPSAFDPRPGVACAALLLQPRQDPTAPPLLDAVLEAAWDQRQRTLRHSLAPLAQRLGLPPQDVSDAVDLVQGRERTALEVSPYEYGAVARLLAERVAARKGGPADGSSTGDA